MTCSGFDPATNAPLLIFGVADMGDAVTILEQATAAVEHSLRVFLSAGLPSTRLGKGGASCRNHRSHNCKTAATTRSAMRNFNHKPDPRRIRSLLRLLRRPTKTWRRAHPVPSRRQKSPLQVSARRTCIWQSRPDRPRLRTRIRHTRGGHRTGRV